MRQRKGNSVGDRLLVIVVGCMLVMNRFGEGEEQAGML